MNIEPKRAKPSLSDELTVVFLRGNGSPRTFRVPVPALQRSLTALGFVFCLAVLAALFFLALNLIRSNGDAPLAPPAPVAVAPVPPAPPLPQPSVTASATAPAVATATVTATVTATATTTVTAAAPAAKGGFWSRLTGSDGAGAPADPELRKEVEGLHADVARLNAQIDSRKDLPKGAGNLLQLFGPRAILLNEENTNIRVKNARVSHEDGKETLIFEIHNVDPQQQQERGYIVALAKTNDLLMVYPPNAFNPSQNIVLDFTKGETFGVSRFREARATFPAAALANRHPRFQILLFSTDGRVIANQHVEDQP